MEKLFFETVGQGPDMVLLHGWGLHSGIWQFITAGLANEFRVTIIDLPGFGRSNIISFSSIENLIDLLFQVAPKKAIWIGWSLGGLIATKYALLNSECVSKLICVASSPKFLKTDDWPGIEISVLQKFNEQLKVDYESTLMRFLHLQFYGVTLDKKMTRWLNQNIFLYGRPSIHALSAGLSILKEEDLRTDMVNLKCPILYLLGRLDAIVPSKLEKKLQQLLPIIRSVVFPRAGHALFLSHQNEFLTEVRRFCYE